MEIAHAEPAWRPVRRNLTAERCLLSYPAKRASGATALATSDEAAQDTAARPRCGRHVRHPAHADVVR